ncbi:NAD-dependent DNA ligase LigA [Candidatus Pelagibacter sp.]|jgi:DNA ligase (NAD+)|uniref:NAD-dependent DNA ligase LigA n=1 Tax=uncultured Candidatus Pelagibacter sp. TaxID=372654 RepID=UPI002332EB71|nr:NAD-dependent DNA ligase LigA [uncultured Candidatus Pelagibacter sp.]MDB3947460.1 NAD-dependent DNA ligase LigA [Candidatus Pelagibacter sp.]MDB4812345.1 NAD-dependent DNA ligase LigA [Candidatus Pelagibacter sp.]MDC0428061.1 NAD-dependent DNA ligase LigA [Candidatus Pelagibacter sp.]MDC0465254.1 NAD-dependent DNA ligase LigA [Candidatus Pelagibacter sp.]
MNKKKIESEYKKKINLLTTYNKNYYDASKPLVSDKKYDELKNSILILESKYSFLNSETSPSKVVGFKPSKNFQKIAHRAPMLSLANAFEREDLINFEKKILNFLSKNKDYQLSYSAEPKIDGISASLIYKNGEFKIGLSRGDGKEGEDITANLATIKDIPKKIQSKDFPEEIDIRGEVFIQNSDFKNLKEKFANPRNAASGSLRQKNPDETKKIPLKFIAYTFGYEKGLKAKNQKDFLKNLDDWGFKTNPLNRLFVGVDNLLINYSRIEKDRTKIDFDIDGIVYKINNFELQKRLGNVANSPRWAIAHKFASNKAISKILNIEIQIGRTGALTPVAKIKPINIGGVIVSNATLHNEDEIDRKDIRIGDLATIERAGDVIPHILSVDKIKRDKKLTKFIFPQKCPSCGSKTIKEFNNITKKEDAVRRCSSEGYDCEKIAIEKLKHFVSKDAFNIDGFGKKIVENFWSLNLIKLPHDIFNLDFTKIENLEGWGRQSMENLKYSINQRKNISLERLIYSLGIRHIGLENAKILSKYFKSFSKFISFSNGAILDDILNIDGIGETQLKSVKNFFDNKTNIDILKKLQKILKVKDAANKDKNGLLNEKTFMVTGKLNGISRAEVKSLIEENSGTSVSTVTKKLNYLIIGEKPTKKKIDKAKEFNVTILNQSGFLKMLNITS